MTRKRCHRQPVETRPPAGLRERFSSEQLRAIALIHISQLDALVAGADLAQLWEWMGTVLTWSKVAQECRIGEDEIQPVVDLAVLLAARFESDGFVVLNDAELDIARSGSVVMDLLAETIELGVAAAIGDWAQKEISALRAASRSDTSIGSVSACQSGKMNRAVSVPTAIT